MDNQKQVNASVPAGEPSPGASIEQGRWSVSAPKSAGAYWRRSILNDVVVMVEPFKVYMSGGHAWYNNGILILESRDCEWWSIPILVPPNAFNLGSETWTSEPKQEPNPTPANKESTSQKAVIQEPLTGAESSKEVKG